MPRSTAEVQDVCELHGRPWDSQENPAGLAGALSRVTMFVVLVVIVLQAAIPVLADQGSDVLRKLFGAILLVLVTACFVILRGRHADGENVGAWWWAAGVVLTSLALVGFFQGWSLIGLGLAAIAMVAPPRFSAPIILSYGVTVVAILLTAPQGFQGAVAAIGFGALTAVALYATSALSVVLADLHRTREELVRLNIDQERRRISRILHDELGRTLAVIAVRAEAARQTLAIGDDPGEHLEAVTQAVSLGQAELTQYSRLSFTGSLGEELDEASFVLEALGVGFECEVEALEDERFTAIAALLVREGVTNAIKHGSPRSVRVIIRSEGGQVLVAVINDGAGSQRTMAVGTGVDYLCGLVRLHGGRLIAESAPPEYFRLEARLPLRRGTTR